jgi:hypothetical protein
MFSELREMLEELRQGLAMALRGATFGRPYGQAGFGGYDTGYGARFF